MAKLPIYQQQVAQEVVRGGPFAPVNNSMSQGLKAVGQGLSQLAQAQLTIEAREARDYTLNQKNKTTLGLVEYESQLSESAASGTEYFDGIKEYISSQKKAAIENAPNARSKNAVSEYYGNLEASELARAIPKAAQINAKIAAAAVRESVDIAMNIVYRDPSRFTEQLESGVESIIVSDLPENKKQQAVNEFTNDLTAQRVVGMISKSPETALSELESGSFDEYLSPQQTVAYTEAARRQVEANARQIAAKEREILSRQQKQQEAEQATIASDLEIGVSRGEQSYTDVEAAFQSGVITAQKRTQLYKQIDSNQNKLNDYNTNVQVVSAAINTGTPLDYSNKSHQKAVDDYFDNLPDAKKSDPSSIATLVSQTKVIPSQIETMVSAGIRGSSDQAQSAADIVARINDQAPQATGSLPNDVMAFALSMDKLAKAGVAPGRAYDLVYNAVYSTSKEQKEVLNSVVATKDFKSSNQKNFSKVVDKISPSWFSVGRTPSMTNMEAEYNSAVNDYYLMTHDQEVAQELASSSLQRTWGVTWVDGKERVMKYSPEKMYSNGDKTDWIYKQLNDEMKVEGIEGKVSLQADTITAREGERPGYQIMVEQDGIMVPYFKNGVAMRWRPSFEESGEPEKIAKEKEAAIERAKKLQKIGGRPAPRHNYDLNIPRG